MEASLLLLCLSASRLLSSESSPSLLPSSMSVVDDDHGAPHTHRRLGLDLAALHLSPAHEALHQGRFGFTVSNFLALTPLDNTWSPDWHTFFARRVSAQLDALHKVRQSRAGQGGKEAGGGVGGC